MVAYKQDMPPEGGYAPIVYKRVPLKKGIGAFGVLGIGCAITAYGFVRLFQVRDMMNIEKIEMRCSRLAIQPLLEAEHDRIILKQLRRNRDAEERIMKNVEGWELGKWEKSPVFLTLGPDEFFLPDKHEFLAHVEIKPYAKAASTLRDN